MKTLSLTRNGIAFVGLLASIVVLYGELQAATPTMKCGTGAGFDCPEKSGYGCIAGGCSTCGSKCPKYTVSKVICEAGSTMVDCQEVLGWCNAVTQKVCPCTLVCLCADSDPACQSQICYPSIQYNKSCIDPS